MQYTENREDVSTYINTSAVLIKEGEVCSQGDRWRRAIIVWREGGVLQNNLGPDTELHYQKAVAGVNTHGNSFTANSKSIFQNSISPNKLVLMFTCSIKILIVSRFVLPNILVHAGVYSSVGISCCGFPNAPIKTAQANVKQVDLLK